MLLHQLLIVSAAIGLTAADSELCGRFKRSCADNAHCHEGTHCECNDDLVGAPLVNCVPKEKFQCVVQADPHLKAYEAAKANLNFPCKYRLTRVQTHLEGGVPGLAFCSFEVFGYNEIIGGKFFTSGVEVNFAIGDFANQFFRQEDILKFDVNPDGVESSDGGATQWGSGVHSSWNGIDIECLFDDEQRFAILSIPRCGFKVKFRPFNPDEPTGPQSRVPAISIEVGKDTIFGETEKGRYPASLCGETDRQGDDENLYSNRAQFLGLKSVHQAVLFDALNQNISQLSALMYVDPTATTKVLQDADTCQKVEDDFQECPSFEKKVEAIDKCGPILIKKRVTRCMGIKALIAFRGCIKAVCGEIPAGCLIYNSILQSAQCKGPRKSNKFCNQ